MLNFPRSCKDWSEVWLGSYACFGTAFLLTLSLPIPLRLYTLRYWSNPLYLIFDIWALWRSELSQYGIEPFKQQQFGIMMRWMDQQGTFQSLWNPTEQFRHLQPLSKTVRTCKNCFLSGRFSAFFLSVMKERSAAVQPCLGLLKKSSIGRLQPVRGMWWEADRNWMYIILIH